MSHYQCWRFAKIWDGEKISDPFMPKIPMMRKLWHGEEEVAGTLMMKKLWHGEEEVAETLTMKNSRLTQD